MRQIRSSPPQSCFASSSSPRFPNFLKIPVNLHQIKYNNPISQMYQFLESLIIGPNWPFSLESDFSEIQNWGFWWAYHQTWQQREIFRFYLRRDQRLLYSGGFYKCVLLTVVLCRRGEIQQIFQITVEGGKDDANDNNRIRN